MFAFNNNSNKTNTHTHTNSFQSPATGQMVHHIKQNKGILTVFRKQSNYLAAINMQKVEFAEISFDNKNLVQDQHDSSLAVTLAHNGYVTFLNSCQAVI